MVLHFFNEHIHLLCSGCWVAVEYSKPLRHPIVYLHYHPHQLAEVVVGAIVELVAVEDHSRSGVGSEGELRRGCHLSAETANIFISLLQQVRDKGAMVAYGS